MDWKGRNDCVSILVLLLKFDGLHTIIASLAHRWLLHAAGLLHTHPLRLLGNRLHLIFAIVAIGSRLMVVAWLPIQPQRHSQRCHPSPSPRGGRRTVHAVGLLVRVPAALRVLVLGKRPPRSVLHCCLPDYLRLHLATAQQLLLGLPTEILLPADPSPSS